MKIDKDKIIQIAISRFHAKHYNSVYDCFTDALEVYLDQEGLMIIKAPDEEDGRQSKPAEQND